MLEFGDQIPPQVWEFLLGLCGIVGQTGGEVKETMGPFSGPLGARFPCGVQRISASFPDADDELSNCCLSPPPPTSVLPFSACLKSR